MSTTDARSSPTPSRSPPTWRSRGCRSWAPLLVASLALGVAGLLALLLGWSLVAGVVARRSCCSSSALPLWSLLRRGPPRAPPTG